MELLLENLPPSLRVRAEANRECLIAFDKVMPPRADHLFGSHARGDARPDSDVNCDWSVTAQEDNSMPRHGLRPGSWKSIGRGDHFFPNAREHDV